MDLKHIFHDVAIFLGGLLIGVALMTAIPFDSGCQCCTHCECGGQCDCCDDCDCKPLVTIPSDVDEETWDEISAELDDYEQKLKEAQGG